jgi:hypothetical protein
MAYDLKTRCSQIDQDFISFVSPQFQQVVISVARRHDKWKVRVKDLRIDASFEEEYDIVIVCNG